MHMNLVETAENGQKPNLKNFSNLGILILTKRKISAIIIMKIREEENFLSEH